MPVPRAALSIALLLPALLPAQDADPVAVRGRVVDVHGRPVPLADVWLCSRFAGAGFAPESALARARTDADGACCLRLDTGVAGLLLCAAAPGRAVARRPVPAHHRAGGLSLELVLEDAAGLHGRVTDGRGRAVAGAHLLCLHEWWSEPLAPAGDAAVTAADGSFALPRAPFGRVALRIAAEGFAVREEVLVLSGALRRDFALDPAPPQASVRVFGLPVTGAPPIHWLLRARSARRVHPVELPAVPLAPDGQGRVRLPPFAHHEVLLAASSPTLLFDDRPGRSQFLAHVREYCAQGGRLLDGDGASVADVRLCAWDAERPGARVSAVTGRDGGFTFRGAFSPYARIAVALPPELDVLPGRPDGRGANRPGGEAIVPVAGPLLLETRPAAALRGRVVDGARPAGGAHLELVDENGAVVAATSSARDGSFWLPGLGHDGMPLRLCARAADAVARSRVFLLARPGAVALPDLAVEPEAEVSGALFDADGAPLRGWRLLAWPWSCELRHAVETPAVVVTDRDGRFTFRLPPGSHRILPEDEFGSWRWLTAPLQLEPGGRRELVLDLAPR